MTSKAIVKEIEREEIEKLSKNKEIPHFEPGDTIEIGYKIVDGAAGANYRIQMFDGVVISYRKKNSLNASFTLRKIFKNSEVERSFKIYSPLVDSIKVLKRGVVRRAKLYYLRDRVGKKAKIKERSFNKNKSN